MFHFGRLNRKTGKKVGKVLQYKKKKSEMPFLKSVGGFATGFMKPIQNLHPMASLTARQAMPSLRAQDEEV